MLYPFLDPISLLACYSSILLPPPKCCIGGSYFSYFTPYFKLYDKFLSSPTEQLIKTSSLVYQGHFFLVSCNCLKTEILVLIKQVQFFVLPSCISLRPLRTQTYNVRVSEWGVVRESGTEPPLPVTLSFLSSSRSLGQIQYPSLLGVREKD